MVDKRFPMLIVLPKVEDPILIVVAEFAISNEEPVKQLMLFVLTVPPLIIPDDDISPKAVIVPPVVEIFPAVVKDEAFIAFVVNCDPPIVVILVAIE
jgi:hypothetical protein